MGSLYNFKSFFYILFFFNLCKFPLFALSNGNSENRPNGRINDLDAKTPTESKLEIYKIQERAIIITFKIGKDKRIYFENAIIFRVNDKSQTIFQKNLFVPKNEGRSSSPLC
jgi:hypothetical protein